MLNPNETITGAKAVKDGVQPRIVVTFGTTEADYLSAVDSTANFQAAVDAVNSLGGGELRVKRGTYTLGTVILKQGVSIIAEKGVTFTLKAGAGTMFVSANFATASKSGVGLSGINKFELRGFIIRGNSANQTDSGAADYAGRNALIKLYGWRYRIQDVHLYDAKEIALYTEHAFTWETALNNTDFAEAVFSEIFIKHYGTAGWVHRGPHDSHAHSVLISSNNSSGLSAKYGLIVESDSLKYGANGFIANGLHVWGDHSQNAILLNGCNLLMSTLYAEGTAGAAIRITGGGQNDFQAFVSFAAHGVQLDSTGDNSITVSVGANVPGSAFKLGNSISGNRLTMLHGTPATSVFDLSTYTNGAFNTFISRAWNTVPFSGGSVQVSDRVDAISDYSSQSSRVTQWKLPVQGTKVEITNAGLDLGGLPIINASKGATGSRPSAATAGQGTQFYDTTLSKPIWSDGTNWRDAAGAIV